MIEGKNVIGFEKLGDSDDAVVAVSPADGSTLAGSFSPATSIEIDLALRKASQAYLNYKFLSGSKRAAFLEAIGEEIMSLGDELVHRAMAESALPEGRIVGERGRTVNQLKLFASLIREGSWVEASIDQAIPDREPLPKSDIRKMLVPIGPVVVFTASNFPLAFSTAGGDTASALAAGNPVIVKAHESHLGTNELVAGAIARAAEKTGMPDGVFSTLIGSGYELGQKLVTHPGVKAVAFTGSLRGGKALYDLAAKREEPIPVFAEMGSINPVFLFPEKTARDAENMAATYAGSITLGVGQFCTNPGLLVGIKSEGLTQFEGSLIEKLRATPAGCMLNKGIADTFLKSSTDMLSEAGVSVLKEGNNTTANSINSVLVKVSAEEFLKNPKLHQEVFGPYCLIVECDHRDDMLAVANKLEGQLTATILAVEGELSDNRECLDAITEKVGRVIYNGAPTGVEVCHSMHHGGPFPATTDGRFTSVGTAAIKRFVRPVAFQDLPDSLLPEALKRGNPLGIWRTVDGEQGKA